MNHSPTDAGQAWHATFSAKAYEVQVMRKDKTPRPLEQRAGRLSSIKT